MSESRARSIKTLFPHLPPAFPSKPGWHLGSPVCAGRPITTPALGLWPPVHSGPMRCCLAPNPSPWPPTISVALCREERAHGAWQQMPGHGQWGCLRF